ncbi:hypothetical protein [Rubellimicrobium aerolatum]|uniref:Uncharacterized protein n=1 Tax=Rubellimicrobium aerolatum TaxID=490979 RepID=A0ABW0SBT3_9RHOB|nr:hypothetical protein [Rubellimicrobium aerolatum]MBP1805887.1 hypothetical protein [Rubellimicrobium aerolatum]
MAEATNELLLQVLRQVQVDLTDLKKGMDDLRDEVRSGLGEVNQKVDGLTVIVGLLAGHVHHVEQRVEALESHRS